MARKGNPMSVRLDLNRSSDSSRFSEGDRVSHRMGQFFPFFVGSISTCLSMCLHRYFHNIVFNPLDLLLMPLVLLSLITIYQWLSFRKVKMPFQLKLIVHLVLVFLTILVVVIVRDWGFRLIAVGAITSSCMMMDASGPRGDDHPSSSFFEGISAWVQNTTEPGEERNSQPSPGVGQRLPGSLEISSPDWTGYLNGNENAEKAGAESSTGHNPAHPPTTARSSGNHQVLQAGDGALENTLAVADLLQQIQRGLHARVPGGFQAEALTETLETRHGTDKLGEIRESLQTEGSQSPYFREFQTDFRSLRDAGGTEKQLRKEWQGRG